MASTQRQEALRIAGCNRARFVRLYCRLLSAMPHVPSPSASSSAARPVAPGPDTPGPSGSDPVSEALRRERGALLAFIRSRVGDADLAEDLLQDSLLRALEGAANLRDGERVTAWLYGIVRHAITDAYRRRGVRTTAQGALAVEAEIAAEGALAPDDEARLCACVQGLVRTLAPDYARVVEADLAGRSADAVAAELGITRTNLKVRRHRAHRQLRERLEQTCRTCAAHGCLDCSCTPSHA